MKKLDVTEKLDFDEAPAIVIRGEEITVDDSAPTVLKIMELMEGEVTMGDVIEAGKLLFHDNYEKVVKISKKFKNLQKVIEEAMDLATGEAEGE